MRAWCARTRAHTVRLDLRSQCETNYNIYTSGHIFVVRFIHLYSQVGEAYVREKNALTAVVSSIIIYNLA